MLNYLSAELWRMTRRRAACTGWGIYLCLAFLSGLTLRGTSPWECVLAFRNFMLIGLYVAMPLAGWAGGGLDRAGGLTNEVSFGLPRTRIYLGKLSAALLAGTALFLLTTAAFFLGALSPEAVLDAGGEDRALAGFALLYAMFQSLPRYVGAAALAHLLVFSLHTAGLGAVLYYLYLAFGELMLAAVSFHGLGVVGTVLNILGDALQPFLLCGPYFSGMPPVDVGQSWLVGAAWVAATSAVGIALFRRREIR